MRGVVVSENQGIWFKSHQSSKLKGREKRNMEAIGSGRV